MLKFFFRYFAYFENNCFLLDLITLRDPDDDDETPDPRTVVAVEVSDARTGANHYWSIEKLR